MRCALIGRLPLFRGDCEYRGGGGHELIAFGRSCWLFIPVQQEIQQFLAAIEDYPFQEGVTVGGEGIKYRTLRNQAILKQLTEQGLAPRPGN